MKTSLLVYSVLFILVGGAIICLSFGDMIPKKWDLGDVLINLLLFLLTMILAEVVKLVVERLERPKGCD